ncbi:uncharacterized protein METZ01_LOCUS322429, partial [marine metagenome]
MMLFDSICVVLVLIISFSINKGFLYWPPDDELFRIIIGAPVIAIPVFLSFRLYRSVVRYIGFRALWSIAQAVTLYAVVWGLFSLMSNHPVIVNVLGITSNFSLSGGYFEHISRSVIFINWMLALIVIGSSRLLARWIFSDNNLYTNKERSKVIIYGAGSAGRQLSQALQ